jgi:hypothetical protein
MAALGQFNAQEHDTAPQEYELLPDGIYRLEIIASEVKEDGNNKQVPLTISVIEPDAYKGRQLRLWLDYEHDNPEYQARGQRELASICRAVGVPSPLDTEELHLIGFTAKVKKGAAGVSRAGNAYKARNSISRYYYEDEGNVPEPFVDASAPANDNKPAARVAANTNNAAAAKPAGSRPWGKKAA